jgi:hypothetical protein
MLKTFLILGSINAFLPVALGAFGVHGLKSRISEEMLKIYQTGIQQWHQRLKPHEINIENESDLSAPKKFEKDWGGFNPTECKCQAMSAACAS